MTGYQRMAALVETLLSEIGLPRPWSLNRFLDGVEGYRGRPIDLCEVVWTPGAPTGAWLARPDHDVIVYPANTTRGHQDQIVLHELGHMLAGHSGRCVLPRDQLRTLAPTLSPVLLRRLLPADDPGRAGEEDEAEWFATLLSSRVTAPARESTPPATDTVAARLTAAFDQL